jgi:DNA replication and repair protein RecF
MIFRNLTLFNFKNFEQLTLEFDPNINCLVGKNGVGKTNILDALHYLSMTKSAVNSLDSSNIRYGEKGFMIKAAVEKEELKYQVLGVVESGK